MHLVLYISGLTIATTKAPSMLTDGSPTPNSLRPDTKPPGTMASPLTTLPPQASKQCNEPGWTNWTNTNTGGSGVDDIEFLPNIIDKYSFCGPEQIAYIQCRQVSTGASYDQADDERSICNTNAGFACYGALQPDGKCEDYEIRVYCECVKSCKLYIEIYKMMILHE